MDIRFVSSLTPEHEEAFAPALLKAMSAVLDQLPIAYTVRIETTGATIHQHSHTPADVAGVDVRPFAHMRMPPADS